MIEDGGAFVTVIVTVAVALPPEFIARTVYVLVEDNTVGVPEISPVEVENTSPVGNVGEIDQEVQFHLYIVESLLSSKILSLM